MKNFMELARLIAGIKQTGEVVKLHLVTHKKEDNMMVSKQHYQDKNDSLSPIDIEFTKELHENLHHRPISADNGWKILLGRGLDIFQKAIGWYDVADHCQEVRKCK